MIEAVICEMIFLHSVSKANVMEMRSRSTSDEIKDIPNRELQCFLGTKSRERNEGPKELLAHAEGGKAEGWHENGEQASTGEEPLGTEVEQ